MSHRQFDSPFLTAGQVFGNGNGRLGAEVCNEDICRNEARKEKGADIVSRKKMKLWKLISRVKVIKDEMKCKNYKLTVDKLCLLVTYKKTKEDVAIPSGKAALLARWNETKHRLSLRCSPNNSDDEEGEEEEEEEGNSIVFEEMGTTGLVFGHVDSEHECEE
jgi:hypothetical protein